MRTFAFVVEEAVCAQPARSNYTVCVADAVFPALPKVNGTKRDQPRGVLDVIVADGSLCDAARFARWLVVGAGTNRTVIEQDVRIRTDDVFDKRDREGTFTDVTLAHVTIGDKAEIELQLPPRLIGTNESSYVETRLSIADFHAKDVVAGASQVFVNNARARLMNLEVV